MSFLAMERFLDLPREIRHTVCEHCLVVSYELNPHPTKYERKEMHRSHSQKPDTALLETNKQVRAEAATVFYGKNVWHVSPQGKVPNPPDPKLEIWEKNASLFRHVIVSFDFSDMYYSLFGELFDQANALGGHATVAEHTSLVRRTLSLHEQKLFERACGGKITWVGRMPHLLSLALKFTHELCDDSDCPGSDYCAFQTTDTVFRQALFG